MKRKNIAILSAYNRYLNRGGEDVVFEAEAELLREHGTTVIPVETQVREPDGLLAAAILAGSAIWSPAWSEKIKGLIETERPDVTHIHNFWPNMSPSIISASLGLNVPVVITLHNFRFLCPAAICFRDGLPCTDCLGKTPPMASVWHRCYQGSRMATSVLATMLTVHRLAGTWSRDGVSFIALTNFAKELFVRGGLPADRIHVKPNFVWNVPVQSVDTTQRSGALFVGRLSQQKGFNTLMRAWDGIDVPLRIAGDGPLLDTARGTGMRNVDVLGRMAPEAVAEEMARAAFLVFPSEWYEGFPMTLVEAFCQGLPVIASRLGSMAEIVEDGVTGLHFTPGDAADLAAKVRWAAAHPKDMRRMGASARRVYEEKYTPEVNYKQLMAIYEQAIESNRRSPGG